MKKPVIKNDLRLGWKKLDPSQPDYPDYLGWAWVQEFRKELREMLAVSPTVDLDCVKADIIATVRRHGFRVARGAGENQRPD